MKIFWTILTDCYPKSAFLIKTPLSSSIKSETVEKGKEVSEIHGGGLQKGQKWVSCTLVVSKSAYMADIQRRLIIRRNQILFSGLKRYISMMIRSEKLK